MDKTLNTGGEATNLNETNSSSRRSFIKLSSAAVLTALAFGALNPETLSAKTAFYGLPIDDEKSGSVDLGKGDTGVLNYAYALEQLEAAFYSQVISTPFAQMSSAERAILPMASPKACPSPTTYSCWIFTPPANYRWKASRLT